MAQYRDLAAFAQFGADQLDKATQAQLGRGQRLTEILKQDQYAPFTVEKQVLSLFVATSGALDSIPVPAVRRFEREFIAFVETNHSGILKSIAEKKALDDTIKGEIKKAVEAFKERFAPDVEEAGESAAKAAAAPAKNQDGAGSGSGSGSGDNKAEEQAAKKVETPVAK
jgi:F-type H+-transporting ATPase subunit alpha